MVSLATKANPEIRVVEYTTRKARFMYPAGVREWEATELTRWPLFFVSALDTEAYVS